MKRRHRIDSLLMEENIVIRVQVIKECIKVWCDWSAAKMGIFLE